MPKSLSSTSWLRPSSIFSQVDLSESACSQQADETIVVKLLSQAISHQCSPHINADMRCVHCMSSAESKSSELPHTGNCFSRKFCRRTTSKFDALFVEF